MAATIVGALQPDMQKLITESRILLIGAGGIGCEVLKNLVLTGFSELDVIDLDTIDVSNLNRQFLFSKDSVGKSKAHVARESVMKFNPNVNIKSHWGDIMDQKFGAAFYLKFKLVINALDNRKARNHVNRMCLSADIPLIESGTLGYQGQVELIKKGMSMCYECLPKPTLRSFPMCTIRNTPKEPIHCITWSKYLFGQLFGESEEDVSMEENVDGSTKVSARQWAQNNDYEPHKMFKKIFIDDIHYLLSMNDLYKEKDTKPIPLDVSIIEKVESSAYKHEPDNKVLELSQYVLMFLDSIRAVKKKFKQTEPNFLVWDKDDEDFMNFVVACTNIRSKIFNIEFKSHFEIKSMAGNIVPAISTANAMVGGQIVMHALRILKGQFERCQTVYVREIPNHKGLFMVRDRKLQVPNPNCSVCSSEGQVVLVTDIFKFTVRQLDDLVLKQSLNMVAPDLIIENRLILSSDEEDEVDFYAQTLGGVGIQDGSIMSADDYFQDFSIKIKVVHKFIADENELLFEILGRAETLQNTVETNAVENDNDDDCIMDNIEGSSEDKSECNSDKIVNNDGKGIAIQVGEIMSESENGQEKTEDKLSEQIADKEENNVSEINVALSNTKEVSNEEILAVKRKATANDDVSEPKKSRTSE